MPSFDFSYDIKDEFEEKLNIPKDIVNLIFSFLKKCSNCKKFIGFSYNKKCNKCNIDILKRFYGSDFN